jgi:hypothetical protein
MRGYRLQGTGYREAVSGEQSAESRSLHYVFLPDARNASVGMTRIDDVR